MNKKTLVINIFLVFSICVVGIVFASMIFSKKSIVSPDVPVVSDSFELTKVISNKLSFYDLEITIFKKNQSDFEYVYKGWVDLLKNKAHYIDTDTDESVINVKMEDVYGIFQSYLTEDMEWEEDVISFSLKDLDQIRLVSYVNSFRSSLTLKEPITCSVMVNTMDGLLLESHCVQDSLHVTFSFLFEND